ncbi:MAG: hypothetical protein ABJM43_22720 [Paracoccaceae bacterium]
MIFKNWAVIIFLALVGLALGWYWLSIPAAPKGVVAQSGDDDTVTLVATLAGAITTIGASVFGILGRYNDYRKVKLELAEKELELEQKRRALEAG